MDDGEKKPWGDRELLLFRSHQWLVREVLTHYRYLAQLRDLYDDLRSYALIGLWHAIDNYREGDSGFINWARLKIHYAVKDGLRELDYLTRNSRDHIKHLATVNNELAQKTGSFPSFQVLREHGVDTDKAVKAAWFAKQEQPEGATWGKWVEQNASPGADHEVIAHDVELRMGRHISRLPPKLSVVIELIYYCGYTQTEAGEILGLSGSRISQLHTQSVRLLRDMVEDEFLDQ